MLSEKNLDDLLNFLEFYRWLTFKMGTFPISGPPVAWSGSNVEAPALSSELRGEETKDPGRVQFDGVACPCCN